MKTAIVIGASSGIGKELAIQLSKQNYDVVITGRRNYLLEEIKSINPRQFYTVCFDVCNEEETKKHLTEILQQHKTIDVIIYSSGVGEYNKHLDYEIENKTNQTNVIAFTQIACWSFELFKKQQFGHFACITSLAGTRGSRHSPSYNASKAYQINYIEGLQQKSFKLQLPIYITDLRTGFVDTAMAKGQGKFWVAPVEKAAQQIIKAIQQKKKVAFITKRWRLISIIYKMVPRFLLMRM